MTHSGHFTPLFKEAVRTRCIVLEGMAARGSVPSETRRLKPRVWKRPPGSFEGLQARVVMPCAPVVCLSAASVKGLGLCAGRTGARLCALQA